MGTRLIGIAFVAVALLVPWMEGMDKVAAWLPTSALSLVMAVALFLRLRWVEHALFGTAISVVVTWTAAVIAAILQGWPDGGVLFAFFSLLPGLLFCALWIAGWLVTRAQARSWPRNAG